MRFVCSFAEQPNAREVSALHSSLATDTKRIFVVNHSDHIAKNQYNTKRSSV